MHHARANVHIDAANQQVTVNGRTLGLQAKAVRVLVMIASRAPAVVGRAELIEEIWAGNHLVGERGLNQALWAIRSELDDNARNPTFIRTLPREGFQWINKTPWHRNKKHHLAFATAVAASLSAVAIFSMASPAISTASEFELPNRCHISEKNDVKAYKRRRDVVIDIHNTCRLIVKTEGNKNLGNPFVSDDGQHVAFTIREDQNCRFVSFALQNGARTEFETCAI